MNEWRLMGPYGAGTGIGGRLNGNERLMRELELSAVERGNGDVWGSANECARIGVERGRNGGLGTNGDVWERMGQTPVEGGAGLWGSRLNEYGW